MIFDEFEDDSWFAVKDSSSQELTHDIHPYFAKFAPEIPHNLIRKLTEKEETVLDPFCGSGTTLIESLALDRNAVGVDANPLACLIAKVKTTKLQSGDRKIAKKVVEDVSTNINELYGQQTFSQQEFSKPKLPEFYNRDKWFNENVQQELSIIKERIETVENERVYDLLRLSFSRIIVGVSNQESESRYTAVEKNISNKETVRRFAKRTTETLNRVKSLDANVSETVSAKVVNTDTHTMDNVGDESVDFVVTSPPYLNSWDYGLYHKFRFKWLKMNVDKFNNREIGRHLRRKEDKISRYTDDMRDSLSQIEQKMKPGSRCVIVNATGIVDGEYINTNQVLIDEAAFCGLELEDSVSKDVYGPHFGLRASNGGGKQKQEVLLAFRKSG